MRSALEQWTRRASWEEIKARYPSFVEQWKPGYEPRPVLQPSDLDEGVAH